MANYTKLLIGIMPITTPGMICCCFGYWCFRECRSLFKMVNDTLRDIFPFGNYQTWRLGEVMCIHLLLLISPSGWNLEQYADIVVVMDMCALLVWTLPVMVRVRGRISSRFFASQISLMHVLLSCRNQRHTGTHKHTSRHRYLTETWWSLHAAIIGTFKPKLMRRWTGSTIVQIMACR